MEFKVIRHFLDHSQGIILSPGDTFKCDDKEVIELLISTSYIVEEEAEKPKRKKKVGGSDVKQG